MLKMAQNGFFWPFSDSPCDTSAISTKMSTWLDHFRGFWFDCFPNSCAKTNYIFEIRGKTIVAECGCLSKQVAFRCGTI